MKNPMSLLFLLILISEGYCSFRQGSPSSDLRKMIIGKWVLVNDKQFIVDIKKDSILYYYGGKEKDRNPITFSFGDSLSYYENKNAFDFMRSDGNIYEGAVIKEYNSSQNDTIINTIVYIDRKGMDLMAKGRSVSFRRLK